jgi:hypothetical protein
MNNLVTVPFIIWIFFFCEFSRSHLLRSRPSTARVACRGARGVRDARTRRGSHPYPSSRVNERHLCSAPRNNAHVCPKGHTTSKSISQNCQSEVKIPVKIVLSKCNFCFGLRSRITLRTRAHHHASARRLLGAKSTREANQRETGKGHVVAVATVAREGEGRRKKKIIR